MRLSIGLRLGFGCDRETCRRAASFVDEVERLESENPIPLYWNFPVASVLEKQNQTIANLAMTIRKRVENRDDRIVPSGFAGVPHPLLLTEELQHELLWCYRNPWFPALAKLYQMRPDCILPVYPDLISESIDGTYSRHGFRTIGIPIALYRLSPQSARSRWSGLKPFANPLYTMRGSDRGARIAPVAVIYPEAATQEAIEALLASCGKAESLSIVFDLGDGSYSADSAGRGPVERVLRILSRHRAIEFVPFSEQNGDSTAAPVDPTELLKFAEHRVGFYESSVWDHIESLRGKKRKSNIKVRNLLHTIAAAGSTGATSRAGAAELAGKDKLQITSISMAGSVTLIGTGSQATFSEGRLSQLTDHGKSILPGVPARSFFTFGAKRQFLQTESAFSFDRGGQTGLRCMLSTRNAHGPGGVQVVLDYYFIDEPNRLALDITVDYPTLPPGITLEGSPLELCLCSFSDSEQLQIGVEIPDRGPYRQSVAGRQGVYTLYGKYFAIQRGKAAVQLVVAPAHGTRMEWIEFRVIKQRGMYQLWANLGGSYLCQPNSFLSARHRSLSYSIGSVDGR